MTILRRPERRLVAAMKAGQQLDLSACTKRGRTLRGSILREIFLGNLLDERGAGTMRVCGALIEGDLDLTDVRTNLSAEFMNCRFTGIRLDRASIPRLTFHEADLREIPDKKTPLGVLSEVWRFITNEPALLTVLLSAFVVIKVIYVAQGDIQTGLGVFNSAGVATVIAGGLLSAFPLISATLLALASFEMARTRGGIRTRPFNKRRAVALWAIWGSAAISCFLLTPWTIAAASFLLGLLFGFAIELKRAYIRRLLLILFSVVSIWLVVNPLLYAVWLPHENLTITKWDGTKIVKPTVTGYVLSDSNGWVSVLRTGQRRISRFPSDQVTGRVLCRGRTVPTPFLFDFLKNADSPWQTVVDTGVLDRLGLKVHILTNKLQKCS
jgi:hypothetical protein